MYQTSPEIVARVLSEALEICAGDPMVKKVTLSALATGYGRLPFDDFIPLAAIVMKLPNFEHIPEVTLCLQHAEDFARAEELNAIHQLGLVAIRAESF